MPPCSVPLLPLPLESMADPDRSLNCQLPPNVAALAWVCHPKVDANARKAAVIVAVRVARLMCRAPARWDDVDRTSRLHDRNGLPTWSAPCSSTLTQAAPRHNGQS